MPHGKIDRRARGSGQDGHYPRVEETHSMSYTRLGPVGGLGATGGIGGSCWKVRPEWHGGERSGNQADGSCRGSTGHSCRPPTPTALSLRHSWLPHP